MEIDWKALDPQQLPEDLREIAMDCGLDVARYLVETWGGTMLYVPTLYNLKKQRRDRLILNAFDGSNAGELAAAMGVSRRYVAKLVRAHRLRNRASAVARASEETTS